MIAHRNASTNRLRVLAITRLFPNRQEPLACPFQRRQFVALSKHVDLTVLAPLPHLPGASIFAPHSRVGKLSYLEETDVVDGISVFHPRIPYVPRVGSVLGVINAPLYLSGLLPLIPQFRQKFDLVLGAFLFPDAWAARYVARILGLPYVVKAHGTDVNVTARSPTVRPLIRQTLQDAGAAIAVSRPMMEMLVGLGADRNQVVHVANGVDRHVFYPRHRSEARRVLGLPRNGKRLLFVGRLEKEKGLEELILAHQDLIRKSAECISLAIVGEGSLQERLAKQISLLPNVSLLGSLSPENVALQLAAANLLVLPSWAEGTPNVVLEALASGRPVVATHVGGIPDVVRPDRTGLLVTPRDIPALATAIHTVLHRSWSEEEIVKTAPPDWEKSGEMLYQVLERASSATWNHAPHVN